MRILKLLLVCSFPLLCSAQDVGKCLAETREISGKEYTITEALTYLGYTEYRVSGPSVTRKFSTRKEVRRYLRSKREYRWLRILSPGLYFILKK